MEDPEVFERVHAFAFELLRGGFVDGFRIDHVDGLYDPGGYLQRLHARAQELAPEAYSEARRFYVTVEKILGFDEELPKWPVDGTTGYDFLVLLNGLFVDGRNESAMNSAYERFTRMRAPFREISPGAKAGAAVSMARLTCCARLKRFPNATATPAFHAQPLAYAMRESSCLLCTGHK